ncbi:MAG: hypothetical protein V4787_04115 [Pseudomonadota bacterium]
MNILLRLLALAAGLLFAVSAGLAALLMVGFWGVRAAWGTLSGKAVSPFIVRIDPRRGFGQARRTPRADSVQQGARIPDVTDVESRSIHS